MAVWLCPVWLPSPFAKTGYCPRRRLPLRPRGLFEGRRLTAYYNEIDPAAAAWLRELIKRGHIAPGDVDERSIVDVRATDLVGYTQCHFFAGIGVWSYALRRAGWSDDRRVWTGSCPCQPFSDAGAGAGTKDDRHLWPAWFDLIQQQRPVAIFGEQVEAALRYGWLDLVHTDLEGCGYRVGAAGIPAAGVGAPHIRQRLFFVADTDGNGRDQARQSESAPWRDGLIRDSTALGLGDAIRPGLEGQSGDGDDGLGRKNPAGSITTPSDVVRPSPVNGFWRDADWIFCRDGKWRPVEPGTFPLAHGTPARVGRLRAYGNAVNAEAARVWIETVMECLP